MFWLWVACGRDAAPVDDCPDSCPTEIVEVSPADGATGVPTPVEVEVRATPDDIPIAVEVSTAAGDPVGGAQGEGTVTVSLAGLLDDDTEYAVRVKYACAPSDGSGVATCGEQTTTFRTGQAGDGGPTGDTDPPDRVDVLLVVDDSASMAENQGTLAASIPVLVEALAAYDPRFAVATTTLARGVVGSPALLDASGAGLAERVAVGTGGDDKEQGLAALVEAASDDIGWREDARFVAIVVTDEEDCSHGGALSEEPPEACYTQLERLVPVSELVDALRSVRPDVQVHGVVGADCDAYPSERIREAADLTHGTVIDLCAPSWDEGLRSIVDRAVGDAR